MKDMDAVKKIISNHVTLGHVLKEDEGITLEMDEVQLSCPFHGVDAKKSTRYYLETDSMYCWVCKKSWDLYGYLIQKEDMTFSKVVDYLVKKYKIDISSAPDIFSGETGSIIKKKEVSIDGKVLALAKIRNHLVNLRGKIDSEKYSRIVFAFMLLKFNSSSDEKFREDSNKLAHLIVKLSRG